MTKPKIARAKQRTPVNHRVNAACGVATTRLIAGDVRTKSALWAETHASPSCSTVYPEAIRSGGHVDSREVVNRDAAANNPRGGASPSPREKRESAEERRISSGNIGETQFLQISV